MEDANPMNTPMEPGAKLSKNDEGVIIDENKYRSLMGSLRYLTCTRPDIAFAVQVISRYVKGTTDLGLLYPRETNKCVKLAGY